MKKINVFSGFDGISTGNYVLKELGIEIENYYASEIDRKAISIAMYNFPHIKQMGDITKWKEWDIDWKTIDLIIGGSPCTNLSSSGNRLGLDGLESRLFYTYYDIYLHIKSLNPDVKFLLENVKMEEKWEIIMSQKMGCQPLKINSNIASAQNRERLYWTNVPTTPLQHSTVTLSEILEPIENVDDKLYMIKGQNITYSNIQPARVTGRKIKSEEIRPELEEGKKTVQVLGVTSKNPSKSNCLTTVTKDNFVTNLPRGQYPYFYKTKDEILEKFPNCFVRYYTPIELERLQTLPDDFTKYGIEYNTKKKVDITTEISYSKRAEVLGNGWTAIIIKWLLQGLKS